MLKAVTWLDQSNIQYFVHLTVVSCDMEHALWEILYARDVDRNQILRHLLPLHCASSARTDVEHFCPKSATVMLVTSIKQMKELERNKMSQRFCVCILINSLVIFWRRNLSTILVRTKRTQVYRVSQEEYSRLRDGFPCVKVYGYIPKHLCPKLNGYGDNGQRSLKI